MTEKKEDKRIRIEIEASSLDEARELANKALYAQPPNEPPQKVRKGSVFDPAFLLP